MVVLCPTCILKRSIVSSYVTKQLLHKEYHGDLDHGGVCLWANPHRQPSAQGHRLLSEGSWCTALQKRQIVRGLVVDSFVS